MDFPGLRIALLTDQDLASGEPLPDDDWPCDPRPYLPEAEWEVVTLEKEHAVPRILEAHREGFDLWFNLCDGAWDEARPGIEVVQTLERLEVPFTGAHSGCYEPSREAMKRVCHALGILAPQGVEIRTDADVERAAATLRFPLIVKHPSSYASAGLVPESRVDRAEDLWIQVSRMRRLFHGALVEEFIEGDEYTVLVAENPDDPADPIAYQPLVYRFPEGESFKHEDLKWVHYHGLEAGPVKDPALDARLRDEAARFFVGLGMSGYARCDVRVDSAGRPYVLEINPNCGLFYPPTDPSSADLILQWDPAGHQGFARTVAHAALARHAARRRPWRVTHRPGVGYRVEVVRALAAGDLVLSADSGGARLARTEPMDALSEADRRRLAGSAWPLGPDCWILPPEDPMAWRPLEHSCDPSAHIVGAEVRALRRIVPGEAVTVDFEALYDGWLPPFACRCEAPGCRGTIGRSAGRPEGV